MTEAQVSVSSACRCTETQPVFPEVTDPNSGDIFAVVRCSECGLLSTVPKPAAIAGYYGEKYYGNRHWIWARYCAWRRRRIINFSAKPGRLLDVGCGDGEFLLAASRAGWDVTGTELDRSRAASRGLFTCESVYEASLSGSFRCITLWHVLEHLADPLENLHAVRTMLDPDGALVIAVPNAGGWQARLFGRYWFHLDVPRHLYHFEEATLTAMLASAGFQVASVWHHELEYDWFGWIQSALNIIAAPNTLFNALMGKARQTSRPAMAAHYCAAAVLAPLAFGLTVISTLAGRGGTIIVAARPSRA